MTQWDGKKGIFTAEKLKKLEELCPKNIWMLKDNPNKAWTVLDEGPPPGLEDKFKKVSRAEAKKLMGREYYERLLSCGYSDPPWER